MQCEVRTPKKLSFSSRPSYEHSAHCQGGRMVSPRYIGAYMAYDDTHDLLEVLAEVGVVDLDGGGGSLGHGGDVSVRSGLDV